MRQKTVSYIGPSNWNSLRDSIKKANSLNPFKHNVKKYYLNSIIIKVYMCILGKIFKNGLSKFCGRQPIKKFEGIWSA